ncbi:GTPase IMAP family member 4-like [Clinocottus analis]|uniref:GTPase IMAP family member 4-like n=1 Tax=Clinocottus analis TaxID=304258 RepID=UPI0035BFDBB5
MAAALAPEEQNQSRVAVLLLGERLSGKSSVGNVILGTLAFRRKTAHSSRGSAAVCGAQVTVVDTPGWRSHSPTPGRVSVELSRGLALCGSEPHVVLLVLNSSAPFGPEQWGAMEAQLRLLQTPIWHRALVIFTHGDQLGLPIQDHIRRQGRQLQWLLERCQNRYQVMTDRTGAPGVQVSELFEKIRKVTEANERPAKIRDQIYTRLRREARAKEDMRRSRGGREETEMAAMHAGKLGRWEPTASGRTRIPRGFLVGAVAGSKPALSLVLLGRRKSGKSSAGNAILDRDEFRVDVKTTQCCAGRGEVSGRTVTVVDSPGWSRFGLADPKEVRLEIGRSPSLCPEGVRPRFLLAVPVDSFGEADRSALEAHVGVLGPAAWRCAAVLFTYAEQLGGRRPERHVEREGRPLQRLLDRCGGWYHVLDHTGGSVERLLEMMERL